MNLNISIKRDYSRTPGPRRIIEGPFSGEDFRKKILTDAIRHAISINSILTIDLDGTTGYPPSFIEESFGGLVRYEKIDPEQIIAHLKIISKEEPELIDEINEIIRSGG